ncbi:MAG TPA: DUF2076 domain-containing protein [Stellaceae bacterium]|nr:DUF2076 domain-containing protein [Stellaceae bacterium]
MTPQERDLITALLARLQQQSGKPRDPEADALIRENTAKISDAHYLLVQTVLIQDMALHEAQNRIAELERARGAAGESEAPPSFLPPRPSQGGPTQGTVPSAGRFTNAPSAPAPQREPVWTQNYAAPPPTAAQPVAPPPLGYGPGYGYGPQMLAGGGSGFLRQAAATAAGVVGGSLLFQGLHSMFAPTYGSGFLSGMPMQPGLSETVINNYYNDDHPTQQAGDVVDAADVQDVQDVSDDAGQDFADNDPGVDPGGDGGGYDV